MKTQIAIVTVAFGVSLSTLGQQSGAPKPPIGIPDDAKLSNGKWYLRPFEPVAESDWEVTQ